MGKYRNLKICVAVSGGKDSMALLHYLLQHANEHGITVSALNCDHDMRPSSSEDSAFVADWCKLNGVPLLSFKWHGGINKTETTARLWRRECYSEAIREGADAIATAHHSNDNAETVLFNLARGSALSGLTGITDTETPFRIIRPLICCGREEIDKYIDENNIPFVVDETNFSTDYSRNRIRLNVLPEIEKAVHGATRAICRFSRIAAEDEKFFENEIAARNLYFFKNNCAFIAFCNERPLFSRTAIKAVRAFQKKDYTFEHAEALYALQFAENGKKFEFLGLTAFKENSGIAITENKKITTSPIPFAVKTHILGGVTVKISPTPLNNCLYFDGALIPSSAVLRTRREGDFFIKFGGGKKSLGDFFTDRKIPLRLRDTIPLIADGNEILAVCGVEISEKIKVTATTKNKLYIYCETELKT